MLGLSLVSLDHLLLGLRSPVSLRLLLAPLGVLSAGFVLWWLAARRRSVPPESLATRAAAALASISLVLGLGLPLSRMLGASSVAGATGPVETSLAVAGIVGMAASPVVFLGLRHRSSLVDWSRTTVHGAFATRGELLLLGLILALFALLVIRLIAVGSILGFDESIYALTSRWWVEGTPNTGWATHRSPGISLLGIAALPFGAWEAPYRAIGLLFGLGAVIACWRLARQIGGPAAGLVAALAVASVPDFQLNSASFLTDVPSAALIVLLMLLAWRSFESARVGVMSRDVLGLAVAAAAAFYVRYGASVPIAFVALAVLLVWSGAVVRSWRLVVATALLLVVLLVPHMTFATVTVGSPWSIALGARNLAAPAYPGQALQVYLRDFFSTVAGPIAGIVAVSGVAAAAWHVLRVRRADRLTRAYAFVLVPALGVGILLGVVALAQTRYVYVPIMLLSVAGGIGLAEVWQRLPALLRAAGAVLGISAASAIILGAAVGTVATQASHALTQRDVVEISQRIRADALSRSTDGQAHCSVLTYVVPDVTWYSGCAAYHFGYPAQPGRETQLTMANRYLLLMEGSTARQPQGDMLQGYLRLVDPAPIIVVRDLASGNIAGRVYRIRTPASAG